MLVVSLIETLPKYNIKKFMSYDLSNETLDEEDSIHVSPPEYILHLDSMNAELPLKGESFDMWDKSTNKYFPISTINHVKELPTGIYGVSYDNNRGFYLELHKHIKEDYVELTGSPISNVIGAIDLFFQREHKFREYDMIFRRGVIMYGPPGCGKSVALKEVADLMLNKYNGIIIDLSLCSGIAISDVSMFITTKIRSIEPNRPIGLLIEDIDDYTKKPGNEAALINLLDGFGTIDNVVYLATTNNPEKLHDRILNRPNRFDIRLLVDYPTDDERKQFILGKLTEEDSKQHDIEQWVADTNGFSLSHISELIKLVVVFDHSYEHSIKLLKEMNRERPDSSQFSNPNKKRIGLDTNKN